MSDTATPGSTITPSLTGAPQGLVGTLTVSLLAMPSGTVIVAATTSGITEYAQTDGTSNYVASIAVPANAPQGDAEVRWVNGSTIVRDDDWTISSSPPTGVDLCTLADVRALMQKKDSDTTQDALIGSLITRASVKIMSDYGREFVPGGPDGLPATGTRTFEYAWGDQYPAEAFVSLAPFDLQSVTEVQADTDQPSPVTLTTDEWRLWPQPPARGGVYLALKVLPLNVSVGIIGWRKRQIQVTGTWGFPSIPVEVVQATAETVIHWLTAYPAVQRMGSPDSEMAPVLPRSYPMTAVDLLSSFKRMTV